MPGVFLADWWGQLSILQQSLWLVAVSSSLLLVILIVLSLLQPESEAETNARFAKILNPRTILAFLTFFGWAGLLASYYLEAHLLVLLLGSTAGVIAATTAKGLTLMLLRLAPRSSPFNADRIMKTTGRVLNTVPSHRNGFGKVHLDMRGLPYEIEAMTAGTALKAGDQVRVVGVLEERVLLVEPIEEDKGYPHKAHRLGR
jgi:membrane protein implicated in regulation of membrane protease activity